MNIYKFLITISACLFFIGCEKVIEIDLKNAPNKLVIEGQINNQAGPYLIRLTKSLGFSQPNVFPGVSGALVIVKDNTGVIDTLIESSPGVYLTKNIQGIEGRTYELFVLLDGNTYTSVSKMPMNVLMDSLDLTYISFAGSERPFPTPIFTDIAGVQNNYRFVTKINGKQDKNNIVWNDNVGDGTYSNQPVFADKELKKGDTVELEMQCIDANVYNYFFTLGNTDQGVTPANPPKNIKGDCLGYFSAYTTQKKIKIIP